MIGKFIMIQQICEIAHIPQVTGTRALIAMGILESHAESVPDQVILRPAICAELVQVAAYIPLIMILLMIRILLSAD